MSYPQLNGMGSVIPAGTGVIGVDDLDAAAAVHGEYLVLRKCMIRRLMFIVSEAVLAATTAPVVRFSKRITPGSDTGVVVLGSMTIPSGSAIGKVVYKDIEPVELNPGDAIMVENTQQTVDPGSGTETGQGYYGFELEDCPESPSESGDMVESA